MITALENKKTGWNSFQIKIIALLLMTLDHIAYFFGGIWDIPFWFHLLGRISAPLFIFITAYGFFYTRNRLTYMKRLYLCSAAMGIGNYIMNLYFTKPDGGIIMNNIFATLFLIVYFLYFIEKIRAGNKSVKGMVCSITALILPLLLQAAEFAVLSGAGSAEWNLQRFFINLLFVLVPVPMLVEGSVIFIIFGICLYYGRNSKMALAVISVLFAGFFFVLSLGGGFDLQNLFILNNQWFMIFSLPFMLLYNREKGRSMKAFFYVYYPAHIYLFAVIAFFCRMTGAFNGIK